jgi:hypothetical protein
MRVPPDRGQEEIPTSALRRLGPEQSAALDARGDLSRLGVAVHPLEGIDDRKDRDRGAPLPDAGDDATDEARRYERPSGVVDEHDVGTGGTHSCGHRVLSPVTSDDEPDAEPGQPCRRGQLIERPIRRHDDDAADIRGGRERFDRPAQQRPAGDGGAQLVLTAHPPAAASGHDDRISCGLGDHRASLARWGRPRRAGLMRLPAPRRSSGPRPSAGSV